MFTDMNRVIVEDATCASCDVPIKRVRHRDFPEVRAECCTVAEGAAHLARKLASARECVGSDRHRTEIDQALKDVAAFRETLADECRPSGCREALAPTRLESPSSAR